MLEKDITNRILKYLRTLPHCFCWKEHGGMYSTSGMPDIICCINGIFYAFEVKTPIGRLTLLQQATIDKINDAGGRAYKVTSPDEVKNIIQKYEEEII